MLDTYFFIPGDKQKFLDKIDELEQENLNLLENLKEFENVK